MFNTNLIHELLIKNANFLQDFFFRHYQTLIKAEEYYSEIEKALDELNKISELSEAEKSMKNQLKDQESQIRNLIYRLKTV